MAAKKKAKKSVDRDRKLIAGKQDHEVSYEARRSGVSKKTVKKRGLLRAQRARRFGRRFRSADRISCCTLLLR